MGLGGAGGLAVYAAAAAAAVSLAAAQGVAVGDAALRAGRRLHDAALAAVARATAGWLDSQPTGRVLARFAGDVDGVDNALPASVEQAGDLVAQCALALALVAAVLPAFALLLAPLALALARFFAAFRPASRALKRLDSLARSPLVAHASATLAGLAAVRAHGLGPAYAARAAGLHDGHSRASWALFVANRWVAVRLDLLTAAVSAATALLCAAARGTVAPGLAGLALTYGLLTAGIFQYSVRLLADCESQLTSVQRLEHYARDIPLEPVVAADPPASPDGPAAAAAARAEDCLAACRPEGWDAGLVAAGWPARGEVEFQGVRVRYRPDLPPVLRGLSFLARPGHKVGIVGRTGRSPCGMPVPCPRRALGPASTETETETETDVAIQ
jgi:ABC-type multidrug transport system fused ATPase/permease subunit